MIRKLHHNAYRCRDSEQTRGVSDHGFIHSIYFRDPSGYIIELTAKQPDHAAATDLAQNAARAKLDRWQAAKKTPEIHT